MGIKTTHSYPRNTNKKCVLEVMIMSREITFAEAINEAIQEEMTRDDNVFLIGEDVGVWGNLFGVTKGLLEKFGPMRVLDTPISEAAITGCGVGAAMLGMRPIVEIMYIDFITIAMSQIVNHAAKLKYMSDGQIEIPIVIRTQQGVGLRNAAIHSQSLENWFVHVPGLIVVMPSSPYDAKGLLKSSIRCNNPVIFIEHKKLYRTKGEVPKEEYLIPLGKGEIKRPGKDITIIGTSWMVTKALKAAEILEKEYSIEVEIIDPRTLVPLDEDIILSSIKKTKKCLIVHEAPKTGGWGGEIAALIMEKALDYLDAPVLRLAGLDVPIPYGEVENLLIPNEKDIINTVLKLCNKMGIDFLEGIV